MNSSHYQQAGFRAGKLHRHRAAIDNCRSPVEHRTANRKASLQWRKYSHFWRKSSHFWGKSSQFQRKSSHFWGKSPQFWSKASHFWRKSPSFKRQSTKQRRESKELRRQSTKLRRKSANHRRNSAELWRDFKRSKVDASGLRTQKDDDQSDQEASSRYSIWRSGEKNLKFVKVLQDF